MPINPDAPSYNDEKFYLIARIAGDLAPSLADRPQDRRPALQMAWRTVKSFHPGSEAEVIAAARITALSFAQLDVLRDAAQPNLTSVMKLRYINAATKLSRAISQDETVLARRQKAEELRPVIQQAEQPERINRAANGEAILQSRLDDINEEIELLRAVRRQAEMAAPDTAPAAATPQATAVPPAEPAPASTAPAPHSRPKAAPGPSMAAPIYAAGPGPAAGGPGPTANGPIASRTAQPAQVA